MSLDTNDLAEIKRIVESAFSTIPLKVVARFREGLPQVASIYGGDNHTFTMLRFRRMGSNIEIEWDDENNERMASTIIRGV